MDIIKLSFFFYVLSFTNMFSSSLAQDSLRQYFVRVHNAARAKVGVGPVQWDEKVARFARKHANQLLNNHCQPELSGGPYGENIAIGRPNLSGSVAFGMWENEKKFYNHGTHRCEPGRVCGHYTQVVWRNSVKIGCAKVKCTNDAGTFIICNYHPRGNIVGQRPY